MKNRWARVAEPTSTSRRPVANGSSVPACPTLCLSPVRSRSSRRTRATTSCDVIPAGFAYRITPDCVTARSRLLVSALDSALVVACPAARHQDVCTLLDRHPESARSPLELLGDACADVLDELREWFRGRRSGGLAMAAAAQRARDHRHVDLPVGRAQAHLAALAVEQLTNEHRDLRVLYRAQVVDDAFGVRLDRAGLAEVAAREVSDRDATIVVAAHARERTCQKLETRERQGPGELAGETRPGGAGGEPPPPPP